MSRFYSIRMTLPVFCLSLLVSTYCLAGIPVLEGEYSTAYTGEEFLTLMVLPDGSGPSFDEAFLPTGGTEDATITLRIWDAGGVPIAHFPAEDMWLEARDGELALCQGGSVADANTDAAGATTWTSPLKAGGQSQALAEVIINGSTLDYAPGLKINFNSPDINGDLTVNLTDVQIFSADFFAADLFRSDFYRDGVVNLSDLPPLAAAVGINCP